MRKQFRAWLVSLYSLLLLLVGCAQEGEPYRSRGPMLFILDNALHNYACDHGGWFPEDDDPYQALAQLYPAYCAPGTELAGLTGDIPSVTNALARGQSISNISSWIYVPGYRQEDDARFAIVWEAKPNRQGVRPVLLLDRTVTNVPKSSWQEFVRQQEHLRKAAAAERVRRRDLDSSH